MFPKGRIAVRRTDAETSRPQLDHDGTATAARHEQPPEETHRRNVEQPSERTRRSGQRFGRRDERDEDLERRRQIRGGIHGGATLHFENEERSYQSDATVAGRREQGT